MGTKQHFYNFIVGFFLAHIVLIIILGLTTGFDIRYNEGVVAYDVFLIITLGISTAIFEELIFRYWLTSYLVKLCKSVMIAMLLSSVVFALLHLGNNHVTYFAVFSHFLGGMIYASTYLLSKSLWLPIGIHFGWNFTQYNLSLPMSGSLKEGILRINLPENEAIYGGDYGIENGWISIVCRLCIFIVSIVWIYRSYWGIKRQKPIRFSK